MPGGPILPAAWNYGAVERALREAANRGERCIFEPKIGQVFQSLEEGYEFFNMYSWEVGFGVRYGRSRINNSRMKTRQDIVCSCEGRDKSDISRSSRCECPCKMSLLRSDDEAWQSVRTLCAKLAQESIEGDMSKTLEVFARIKARDPGFSVSIDLDDQKRVRSLLFAHGSSRIDYASFGDVVTFDTTYRTNLYNLPFGLFVGVNNHFQSIIFGGVLLTEETIDAFKWTFRNFVSMMGKDAPQTILTDQCHQMRVAIEAELPDTRHRWCKWHVLRKAKESLGPVYSKNSTFKRELHELLDQIVEIEEFETRWAQIITGHGLGENEFLARAYENREMWAKPFFTDTFCAGMTSTQRSESANHVLKTYIPRSAPMHLFVTQYDRLVTDRVADEGREIHATKQVNFILRAGVPIEKHGTRVYTRAMFERFYRELFRSGSFKCTEDDDGCRYILTYANARPEFDYSRKQFVVTCNSDRTDFFCVCKGFEHSGIPCRHVLKVLVHSGAVKIPAGLVKKRWTTSARQGVECLIPGYKDAVARGDEASSMHGLLHACAMELVGLGTTSRQAFEVAVDYVSQAKAAITSMTVDDPGRRAFHAKSVPEDSAAELVFDASCAAPPRVRSRGRPKELRFKSPIESPGARKKPASSTVSKMAYESSVNYLDTSKYLCHCNEPSDIWRSGTESNLGRLFVKCGLTKRCKFWEWEDEISNTYIGKQKNTAGRTTVHREALPGNVLSELVVIRWTVFFIAILSLWISSRV
ncbi:hypothetical protein ACQ4PT_024649 [Festuca glaucescens]